MVVELLAALGLLLPTSSENKDNKTVKFLTNKEDFIKLEEMTIDGMRCEISVNPVYKIKFHDPKGNMSMVMKQPGPDMSPDDVLKYRRVSTLYPYNEKMGRLCKEALIRSQILRKLIGK